MRELKNPYENEKLTEGLKDSIDKRLRYIYIVLKLEDVKVKFHAGMGRNLSIYQIRCLQHFINQNSFSNKFHQLTRFIWNNEEERKYFNEAELCYIKKMVITLNHESKIAEIEK